MKKRWYYVMFILFLLQTQLSAQSSPLGKGSTMLLGSFRFSTAGGDLYENSDGERLVTIEFSPSAGYFFSPGFSLGLQLNYTSTSRGEVSVKSYDIGPQVAYFFGANATTNENKRSVYPFLTASYLFKGISYDNNTNNTSQTGSKLRFGLGVEFLIQESAGLFLLAAYDIDSQKYEDSDSISGNQFGLYAGFNIFL